MIQKKRKCPASKKGSKCTLDFFVDDRVAIAIKLLHLAYLKDLAEEVHKGQFRRKKAKRVLSAMVSTADKGLTQSQEQARQTRNYANEALN